MQNSQSNALGNVSLCMCQGLSDCFVEGPFLGSLIKESKTVQVALWIIFQSENVGLDGRF